MCARHGSPNAPRIVFGVLVLAVGVLFLLDNLGVLYAEDVLRYWPAGLIAIGVAVLSQAGRSGGRLSGVIWIVIGAWLLAGELGLIRVRFWDFWPLVLVLKPSPWPSSWRTTGRSSICDPSFPSTPF